MSSVALAADAAAVMAAEPGVVIMSGGLIVAIPLALLAGFISFASPCVLPVVPGYLALIGATSETPAAQGAPAVASAPVTTAAATTASATASQPAPAKPATARKTRGHVALGAALFVAGFSVIYVLSGAFFGQLGFWFLQYQHVILPILGVVVIAMGFVFIGMGGPMQRTFRLRGKPAGLIGAPLLGAIFALGWAPCIGPTLVAIQTLSLNSASAGRGALLAFAYCVGLGLPFIIAALGWQAATGWIGALKRHIRAINIAGGVLLIVIGLLMVFGIWQQFLASIGAVIPGYVAPI